MTRSRYPARSSAGRYAGSSSGSATLKVDVDDGFGHHPGDRGGPDMVHPASGSTHGLDDLGTFPPEPTRPTRFGTGPAECRVSPRHRSAQPDAPCGDYASQPESADPDEMRVSSMRGPRRSPRPGCDP